MNPLKNICFRFLITKKREKKSPFLQNYAVYYVLCRFLCNLDNRNKKQITEEEFDDYLVLLKEIFERVDDFYLLNQGRVPHLSQNPQILCMFLRIKYGIDQVKYDYRIQEPDQESGENNLVMYFNDHVISSMGQAPFLYRYYELY